MPEQVKNSAETKGYPVLGASLIAGAICAGMAGLLRFGPIFNHESQTVTIENTPTPTYTAPVVSTPSASTQPPMPMPTQTPTPIDTSAPEKTTHPTHTSEADPPTQLQNLAYGSDPQQKLDVYPSEDGQTRPAVIMIHGGGHIGGDKTEYQEEAAELAGHGYTVFNANYRLADATHPGNPMQINDITSVVDWVIANGKEYNADPGIIDMIGGSAGGHLVSLTSLLLNQEKPGTIDAVASLSGPQDLTVLAGTETPIGRDDPIGINAFLGCDAQTTCTQQQLAEGSPITHVTDSCPAMYLMNSMHEVAPASQAQSMYDTLRQAGCDAKLQFVPGDAHAFAYWDVVDDSIVKFFNKH